MLTLLSPFQNKAVFYTHTYPLKQNSNAKNGDTILREKSEFVYQGFVADSRTTSEISSVCVVGFPLAWLSKQRSIGASFLRQRMIALSGIKSHSIQLNYL